jgi:hypothetical protein
LLDTFNLEGESCEFYYCKFGFVYDLRRSICEIPYRLEFT